MQNTVSDQDLYCSHSKGLIRCLNVYDKSGISVPLELKESRQFPDKTVPRHGFWRQFPRQI